MDSKARDVSLGRRLVAITLDWLACYAIVAALSGGIGHMGPRQSPIILALFFMEVWVLTSLTGASLGQKIFGMRVVRFSDGASVSPMQALVRTLFLVLVVTAVTYDENGRGIHERISGTVLARV
ncbi:MAG: RDD family protein [Candidatus Planktophila sp.]|nr:RDD family protein [Candidatus Planktophila sp.]